MIVRKKKEKPIGNMQQINEILKHYDTWKITDIKKSNNNKQWILWFQLYKFAEQWNPICGDYHRLNICCCSVGKSYLTFCNLWTIASQATLSMAFSRQEHRSGLPFPSPGDLSDPGIEPTSAWQADYLPLSHLGRPRLIVHVPLKLLLKPYPQWWYLQVGAWWLD